MFIFSLTGFADGIGWEQGRMSPQYLETFSWCLRWFFLALSCVSYSIWGMDTLSQVKTLLTVLNEGCNFEKITYLSVCVLQSSIFKSIPYSRLCRFWHFTYDTDLLLHISAEQHLLCKLGISVIQLFTSKSMSQCTKTDAHISYLALPDTSTERDLQKVLQQLEPQISFLEELTKMGGAMRTVLTKILTSQQTFKELSMGKYLPLSLCWFLLIFSFLIIEVIFFVVVCCILSWVL